MDALLQKLVDAPQVDPELKEYILTGTGELTLREYLFIHYFRRALKHNNPWTLVDYGDGFLPVLKMVRWHELSPDMQALYRERNMLVYRDLYFPKRVPARLYRTLRFAVDGSHIEAPIEAFKTHPYSDKYTNDNDELAISD